MEKDSVAPFSRQDKNARLQGRKYNILYLILTRIHYLVLIKDTFAYKQSVLINEPWLNP